MKKHRKRIYRMMLILIPLLFILAIGLSVYRKEYSLDLLETVMKVLGLFAAGIFFLYKFFTGWLIINLQVKVEPERLADPQGEDHLAIHIYLTKGATDSVWLRDIEIKVIEGEKVWYVRPHGMERVNRDQGIWTREQTGRMLNIAPGEATQFSAYTRVGRGSVVRLEIAVWGTRPFYSIERDDDMPIQWKASRIVLPSAE